MKIDKIYKLIFGEIIKPKDYQKKFDFNDDYIFITPNSYYGFVVCKKGIPFNLEMIRKSEVKIDLLSVVKPENRLRKTKYFVADSRGDLINIFSNNDRKVYINSKYLKYFEDWAELYQKKDLSLCVVVESGQIVGAVCPIRYIEEKE
jgi:hypothetical protein